MIIIIFVFVSPFLSYRGAYHLELSFGDINNVECSDKVVC